MATDALYQGGCPYCGASRVKVVSTVRPRRYLKCRICGKCFKTIELIEREYFLEDAFTALCDEGRVNEYGPSARKLMREFLKLMRNNGEGFTNV